MGVAHLRLKQRATAFYAIAAASFIGVAALFGTIAEVHSGLIGVAVLVWSCVVGIVLLALLQCPHSSISYPQT